MYPQNCRIPWYTQLKPFSHTFWKRKYNFVIIFLLLFYRFLKRFVLFWTFWFVTSLMGIIIIIIIIYVAMAYRLLCELIEVYLLINLWFNQKILQFYVLTDHVVYMKTMLCKNTVCGNHWIKMLYLYHAHYLRVLNNYESQNIVSLSVAHAFFHKKMTSFSI